jgi:Ca-activated chloride channel family protein
MSFALTNPLGLLGLLLVPYLILVDRASLADQPHLRRRLSLALRIAVVVLLVLAVSGAQTVRRSNQLCVFFILDWSDSMTDQQKAAAVRYVARAVKQMRQDDLAGVIVGGAEALVELAPARKLEFEKVRSTLATTRTDLAAAIRLALAAFPDGTLKKIVLLSDGNENLGRAADEANLAASDDVLIDVVPLAATYEKEVLAEKLVVPPQLKIGEPFNLKLIVRSLQPTTATIRMLRNDEYLHSYDARLVEGVNRLELPQVIDEPGFYSYDCVIETPDDTRAENNRALGFCVIRGQPRVLFAEGVSGEHEYLNDALRASKIDTDVVGLAGVPTALGELQQYDSLILSDVRADLISLQQMKMIRAAVRDLGIGLIMIGGEDSFGIGGYYQTPVEDALPVYMDVRRKRKLPGLAMELVIDKSGSMGGTMPGCSKMDLAKEAAIAAVGLLKPQDEIGIIVFDQAYKEVVELQKATNKKRIEEQIARVRSGGGTQMYGGMERAYQRLKNSDAKLKHCIVLTDGQSMAADHEGLARRMAAAGQTISTVAVGSDSAVGLLQSIAKIGKGNFYFTDSPRNIPRIFTRETMLASRSFVVEKPFMPRPSPDSELLRGIDLASMPQLRGYVVTTKKELGRNSITTPKGDPVLTSWRYGLGRSVAFTSDAKARWAADWISWPGYRKFWEQVVRWTVRSVAKSPYQAWVDLEGGTATAVLEAIDQDGGFVNFLKAEARVVAPGLDSQRLALHQVAPGRYEARFAAREVGQYVVNIRYEDQQGRTASQVTGLEVAYPPEYAELTPNEPLLARVSETTRGIMSPEAEKAFVKRRSGARRASDIWPLLAALALLLFPLDVALRRLMIEREHLQLFADAFARLAWWRRVPVPAPAGAPIGRLLQRKRETAESFEEESPHIAAPPLSPTVQAAAPRREQTPRRAQPRPAEPAADPSDRMRRLLEAKQRARRQ